MASDHLALSIIFPAYNEAGGLHSALESARCYCEQERLDAEIIVVDDGSRDETAAIAREFAQRHPIVRVLSHTPNRGKGYAVRQGMLAATGRYRLFLDVDLATPVEEIPKLLDALDRGAGAALGSRHLPASQIEVKQRLLRRLMGSAFRGLARLILRLPVTDFTCGFKAFRASAAERLFAALTEPGWAFDVELILAAFRWGMQVEEVPVRWRDVAHSAVAPLSAALESLRALLRIRSRDRKGLYDPPPDRGA